MGEISKRSKIWDQTIRLQDKIKNRCIIWQSELPHNYHPTIWWSQTWWFYRPRGQSSATCKWKFEPQIFGWPLLLWGPEVYTNQFGDLTLFVDNLKIFCGNLMIFADVWWLVRIFHEICGLYFHDLGLGDTRSWCISLISFWRFLELQSLGISR